MDYRAYNDYELIYMVRENDDYSYNTLFTKYLPVIKRIALEYYKKHPDYGAEYSDFVQEGYVAFQNAVSSFSEVKNTLFYTYLEVCIRRALSSYCRKITCESKNISIYQFVDVFDGGEDYIENLPSIEDNLILDEFMHRVWDIVYDMDDIMYSCVFELKQNSFSYKEIATLLDISVKEASTIQRKVFREIRQKLDFNF